MADPCRCRAFCIEDTARTGRYCRLTVLPKRKTAPCECVATCTEVTSKTGRYCRLLPPHKEPSK